MADLTLEQSQRADLIRSVFASVGILKARPSRWDREDFHGFVVFDEDPKHERKIRQGHSQRAQMWVRDNDDVVASANGMMALLRSEGIIHHG